MEYCDNDFHADMPKKFICLSQNCKSSALICQSCILTGHSDHRVIKLSTFEKQTRKIFTETKESLPKLIISLNYQMEMCKEIEETTEKLKMFIRNVEDKIFQEKTSLENRLNEVSKLNSEISGFDDDFFEFCGNNKEKKQEIQIKELMDRVNKIRDKLLISGNSELTINIPALNETIDSLFFSKALDIFKNFNSEIQAHLHSNNMIRNPTNKNRPKYVKI